MNSGRCRGLETLQEPWVRSEGWSVAVATVRHANCALPAAVAIEANRRNLMDWKMGPPIRLGILVIVMTQLFCTWWLLWALDRAHRDVQRELTSIRTDVQFLAQDRLSGKSTCARSASVQKDVDLTDLAGVREALGRAYQCGPHH
jgi:hypothetical protein